MDEEMSERETSYRITRSFIPRDWAREARKRSKFRPKELRNLVEKDFLLSCFCFIHSPPQQQTVVKTTYDLCLVSVTDEDQSVLKQEIQEYSIEWPNTMVNLFVVSLDSLLNDEGFFTGNGS